MRSILRQLLLSFAVAASFSAAASDIPQDLNALRLRQAEIKAGVEAHSTGAYKEMSPQTRQELLAKQADLLGTIEGKNTADELSETEQAHVAQAIAWIDTNIKQAADERMICERRQVLGSNRKERVCMTAAQMRQQREAARESMDRHGVCDDCRSQ